MEQLFFLLLVCFIWNPAFDDTQSFQCSQLVASAAAAAAAPYSSGSNNHDDNDKRMIRFSGMQGGEKSMNEKKKGARGHAAAQFILALNSICQPNGNGEGTERRQRMV